jgi:hypothetical protein
MAPATVGLKGPVYYKEQQLVNVFPVIETLQETSEARYLFTKRTFISRIYNSRLKVNTLSLLVAHSPVLSGLSGRHPPM